MKRRQFLRAVGGALGGLLVSRTAPAAPAAEARSWMPLGDRGDESFWRMLRKQFILPENVAYLNTGGLGASPLAVTDKVKELLDREETYPSAGHDLDEWWEIKSKCAPYFGPDVKKEELALTSTATEGINIVVNGLPLGRGDEVITSTHEHVALNIPLLNKMKTGGIAVRTFEPDLQRGLGNVERIEELINSRTRLVFLSHVTCTTGQIFPIEEIGALCRAKGIRFALDGAQATAQIPTDVKAANVDFYAISGHKWLMGPKRTGILYVREGLLETLAPSIVGAYSDKAHSMPERTLELHPTAQRYEYGTTNEALFHGLGAAADFVGIIGLEAITERNARMAEEFCTRVVRVPFVEMLSPAEAACRSAMITFRFTDRNNGEVCAELGRRKLRVRGVGEAGLDGIRVSFHVYNNMDEVERLIRELADIA